jgi:cellobiose-specific phosphotransferase system component IIC
MVKMCECLKGHCEKRETVRSVFLLLLPLLIFGSIYVLIDWQLDILEWVKAHEPYGYLVVGAVILGVVLTIGLVMYVACHHPSERHADTYLSRHSSPPQLTGWIEHLGQKRRHQPKPYPPSNA